MSIANPKQVSF